MVLNPREAEVEVRPEVEAVTVPAGARRGPVPDDIGRGRLATKRVVRRVAIATSGVEGAYEGPIGAHVPSTPAEDVAAYTVPAVAFPVPVPTT